MAIKQTTSVQSIVRERAVADTAKFVGNQSLDLSAFQNFVAGEQKELKEKELLKQNDDDARVLAGLSVAMEGREHEVRQALRTGNWKGLVPENNMARPGFRESANRMGGAFLAMNDRDSFRSYLDSLPPTNDGSDAKRAFVAKNIEGMGEFAAASYNKQVGVFSKTLIEDRHTTLGNRASTMAMGQMRSVLTEKVAFGDVPSMADARALADQYAASVSNFIPFAKAQHQGRELVDRMLTKIAMGGTNATQEEMTHAADLITEPDEAGNTAIMRMGGDYAKVRKDILDKRREIWDLAAHEVFTNARTRMASIRAGNPGINPDTGETDSAAQVMKDVLREYTGKGPHANKEFQTLLKQVSALVASTADGKSGKKISGSGDISPLLSHKMRDKAQEAFMAEGRRLDALENAARLGAGPKMKQDFIQRILAGDYTAFAEVRGLMADSTNRSLDDFIGSNPAVRAIFLASRGSKAGDPTSKLLEELGANITSGGLNLDTAAKNLVSSYSDRTVPEELQWRYNKLGEAELAALGLPEDSTWGKIGATTKADMMEQFKIAAVATGGRPDIGGDRAFAAWYELIKNDYEGAVDEEGNAYINLRKTKEAVRNNDGTVGLGNGYGPEEIVRLQEWSRRNANENGIPTGAKPDAQTGVDGTLQVTVGGLGGSTPLQFSSGQDVALTPELAAKLRGSFPIYEDGEGGREPGEVWARIPTPGDIVGYVDDVGGDPSEDVMQDSIILGPNESLVYDKKLGHWSMRYRDAPDMQNPTFFEEILHGASGAYSSFLSIVGADSSEIGRTINELTRLEIEGMQKGPNSIPQFMTDAALQEGLVMAKFHPKPDRMRDMMNELALRREGLVKQKTIEDFKVTGPYKAKKEEMIKKIGYTPQEVPSVPTQDLHDELTALRAEPKPDKYPLSNDDLAAVQQRRERITAIRNELKSRKGYSADAAYKNDSFESERDKSVASPGSMDWTGNSNPPASEDEYSEELARLQAQPQFGDDLSYAAHARKKRIDQILKIRERTESEIRGSTKSPGSMDWTKNANPPAPEPQSEGPEAEPELMSTDDLEVYEQMQAESPNGNREAEMHEEIEKRAAGESEQISLADLKQAGAAPGSRPAFDQASDVVNEDIRRGREDAMDEMLGDMINDGSFSAQSAYETKGMADGAEKLNKAISVTQQNGGMFDDLKQPAGKGFMQAFKASVIKSENFVGYAYDDNGGKNAIWKYSSKVGHPTVGFGFNLDREDADEMLAASGAPTKEQLLAGAPMGRDVADELLKNTVAELGVTMKRIFPKVPLARHRWVAIMSLAYNGGPSILHANMRAAIRAGNWEGAAWHIKNNTGVHKSAKHLQEGLQSRRDHESALFLGIEDANRNPVDPSDEQAGMPKAVRTNSLRAREGQTRLNLKHALR